MGKLVKKTTPKKEKPVKSGKVSKSPKSAAKPKSSKILKTAKASPKVKSSPPKKVKIEKSTSKAESTEKQNCKIFVGDLARSVTKSDLKDYFSKFGNVEKIHHRNSSTFAFVTFEDEKAAKTALSTNHKVKGNKVKVDQSNPKKQLRESFEHEIILKDVKGKVTVSTVEKLFKKFGTVLKVTLPLKLDGTAKGYAFVAFKTEAEKAKALKGTHKIGANKIVVKDAHLGKQSKENKKPNSKVQVKVAEEEDDEEEEEDDEEMEQDEDMEDESGGDDDEEDEDDAMDDDDDSDE